VVCDVKAEPHGLLQQLEDSKVSVILDLLCPSALYYVPNKIMPSFMIPCILLVSGT